MINGYTQEARVRQLERTIAQILRKLITRMQLGSGEVTKVVGPENLQDLLAAAPREDRKDLPSSNGVGVASGLYWSPMGGGVLLIETKALPKGTAEGLSVTGNLADVMKQS